MPRPDALRHSIPLLFAAKTVEENRACRRRSEGMLITPAQVCLTCFNRRGYAARHIDRLPQIETPRWVMTGTDDTLVDRG